MVDKKVIVGIVTVINHFLDEMWEIIITKILLIVLFDEC